ncbi:MAG: type IV pilus secretin PilQ [Betaproteobacteria bacterium]|nr:type IV pilus secretin PilQ [Betaproteobacteria bacterium]
MRMVSCFTRMAPWRVAGCVGLLVGAWGSAWASTPNSVQRVDYATLSDGRAQIQVSLKDPLTFTPPAFAVNNPPRLAIDFLNTTNGLGANTVAMHGGMVSGVDVVQAGTRTRLVINMTQAGTYQTHVKGKELIVDLAAVGAQPAATNVATHFAAGMPQPAGHAIRNVDFRRGPDDTGRVLVNLADTTTGIDIRTRGKSLVVDFLDTALPARLQRRLDVTDFGTPVRTIDTVARDHNVHMVVTPTGNWTYSAYQTDRQFVLQVKPIATASAQPEKPHYTGEKLSLNLQNVDVRSALQVIADFTGQNIVVSDSVHGNLTLLLKDVPWDQALAIILRAKGLSKEVDGNVIWIAPSAEIAAREKLDLEAKNQIANLEPLRTEIFHLRYARAQDVQKLLTGKQNILSKRGSVVVDPRTNTAFVQDTPDNLERVRALISQIDIPVRQVLISSRIVIADTQFSRQLGVRLGVADQGRVNTVNTGLASNITDSQSLAGGAASTTISANDANVNLPVPNAVGSLALTLLRINGNGLLNLELSALQADGRGKVISSPRVLTADKQKAVIEQGTEIPYQQATSSGATSVSFKDAVLSLAVTPQITPDNKVLMDLDVRKDQVGQIYAGVPSIDTQRVQTQVLVNNGETAVLGGIYEQTTNNQVNKVPVLGDIPVLGNLFKNTDVQNNRSELLIFVTPKILKSSLDIQ